MATKTLTPKQVKFIDEYLIDRNGKQAAIRAGYSPRSAEVQASKMLRKGKVKAEIGRRVEKMSKDAGVTVQRVVDEYAKIAFSNMANFMEVGDDGQPSLNFKDLTEDQKAALSEVTVDSYLEKGGTNPKTVLKVKFKLIDKKGALDSLGKHLGMFVDKVEHSGPDGGPMVIERIIIDPAKDGKD